MSRGQLMLSDIGKENRQAVRQLTLELIERETPTGRGAGRHQPDTCWTAWRAGAGRTRTAVALHYLRQAPC